jgi:hypothetical protein
MLHCARRCGPGHAPAEEGNAPAGFSLPVHRFEGLDHFTAESVQLAAFGNPPVTASPPIPDQFCSAKDDAPQRCWVRCPAGGAAAGGKRSCRRPWGIRGGFDLRGEQSWHRLLGLLGCQQPQLAAASTRGWAGPCDRRPTHRVPGCGSRRRDGAPPHQHPAPEAVQPPSTRRPCRPCLPCRWRWRRQYLSWSARCCGPTPAAGAGPPGALMLPRLPPLPLLPLLPPPPTPPLRSTAATGSNRSAAPAVLRSSRQQSSAARPPTGLPACPPAHLPTCPPAAGGARPPLTTSAS